jgi:hypothetical protein
MSDDEHVAVALTENQWRSLLHVLAATTRREHRGGNTELAREIQSLGDRVYRQVV